jgi:hypothetical protein
MVPFDIGGRRYQIRSLAFADQRKVYSRMQRVMMAYGDELLKDANVGLFMFAGMAGLLTDEDMTFYCDTFGKVTDVDMGDGRQLVLSNDVNRTLVFSGSFADLFEWLDACVEVNFSSVMSKLSGARKSLELAAKNKKEQGPVV